MGFKSTTPVFVRAKTVLTSGSAATVIGIYLSITVNKFQLSFHTFGYREYYGKY
jgi:uncharacterized membrane protein